MAQRMFNLDKWSRLVEGDGLEFINPRPRLVRLEVNAPTECALYVINPEGEVQFLALVKGRDTVEFGSTGAFQLTVEGGECHVYTSDGADISQKVVGAVPFTKIVERRRRNPEMEMIAATMMQNMNRRFEQQAHEYENLLARRLAAQEQQLAGVGGNGAPEPAPSGGSGAPSEVHSGATATGDGSAATANEGSEPRS